MMNLSIEASDETQEDLCTLQWTFLLLVMVISTLQIYFLHICINGLVQLRNANRIGTENMLTILPGVYSDPCGKCFYFFPTTCRWIFLKNINDLQKFDSLNRRIYDLMFIVMFARSYQLLFLSINHSVADVSPEF